MNAQLPKPLLISALAVLAAVASFGCDNPSNQADDSAASASAQAPVADPEADETANGRTAKHTDRYAVRSPEQAIGASHKQEVELGITPADGLKINKEFPWKIELTQPEGVALAQTTFSKAQIDLGEEQATMAVFVESEQAGSHQIEATGDFSVCNDAECYVIRDEPIDFDLEVAAAPGADDEPSEDDQAEPDPAEQDAEPTP
ncbi:MAG: hypothetical protein ACOC9J_04565 [Persicimonas sp.]